jgi:hypothetical protein
MSEAANSSELLIPTYKKLYADGTQYDEFSVTPRNLVTIFRNL